MEDGKTADADDDRPPICPACGVTMGITVDEDGSARYVCLECLRRSVEGFARRASDPELVVAILADRGQASRIVILREGDGDRLAMAARLVEQKHLIADPALETLATL